MRKLLIATVLLIMLIGGIYIALPAIAEYSVRQALTEQQIDASFVLQRPSLNRIEVRELKLEKNTAEQAFTLTADSISLRFNPWQLFNTGRIDTLEINALTLDLPLTSQPNGADQPEPAVLPFPPLPSYILNLIPASSINLSHYRVNITRGSETNSLMQLGFSGNANATNERLNLAVDQIDDAPDLHLLVTLNKQDNVAISLYTGDDIALTTEASLSYQQPQLNSQSQTVFYPEQLSRVLQQPGVKTFIEQSGITEITAIPLINGTVTLTGQSQLSLNEDFKQAQHHYQLNHQLAIGHLPGIERLTLQQNTDLSLNGDALTLTIKTLSASGQQLQINPEPQTKTSQISSAGVRVDLLTPVKLTSSLKELNQVGINALQFPKIQLQISPQPISLQRTDQPDIVLQSTPLKLTLSQINLDNQRAQATLTSDRIETRYGLRPLPNITLDNTAVISSANISNTFTLTFNDRLLAGETQISGSTNTTLSSGRTTGRWETSIPLTGIEKLIRRFLTALPPELIFTGGKLNQQGWFDSNKAGTALRLLNQTEHASLSYDQTHLYAIDWNSETVKNHRGKLDDNGQLKIAFIDAGVPLENFTGRYHLEQRLSGQPVLHLESSTVDLLGGTVTTLPVAVSLDSPNFNTAVAVTGIDLAQLIALEQQEGLSGSGTLNGQMPIQVSNGALTITDGQIISNAEGGWIRFNPPPAMLALTKTNQALAIAFGALGNLHYERLGIELDYQPDGEALLKTHLKGHNPDWNRGQPVDFTINIEENIPKLIQALQFTDKLTKTLEKRYR